MKNKNESGFSLIELILVIAIIGVIAAIAIPLFTEGVNATENSSTNATLKIMLQAQSVHFVQKNRYGRLAEINAVQNESLGEIRDGKLYRGKFQYEMIPENPTDEELKGDFQIKATRVLGNSNFPYLMEINSQGFVSQIYP